MTNHNIEDLEVIGYADRVPRELLPRIVPPVYKRLRAPTAEEEFVLPPFELRNDQVIGGSLASGEEVRRLAEAEMLTLLPKPIRARDDYVVWLAADGDVWYERRSAVIEKAEETSWVHLDRALELLDKGDLEGAAEMAGAALVADERNFQAVLTKAAIERLRKDDLGFSIMRDLAASHFPTIDFERRVGQVLEGYGRVPQNHQAPNPTPEETDLPVSLNLREWSEVSRLIAQDEDLKARTCLQVITSTPELLEAAVKKGLIRDAMMELAAAGRALANNGVASYFERFGSSIGKLVGTKKLSAEDGQGLLVSLREVAEELPANGVDPTMFVPHALKGWSRELGRRSWLPAQEEVWERLVRLKPRLRTYAESVRDSLRERAESPYLKLGWSAWHEDCVLAGLASAILDLFSVDVLATRRPLHWGSFEIGGERAEVAFMNELAAEQTYIFDESYPVYSFQGYYGFGRAEFLEELLGSDKVPETVRVEVQRILGGEAELRPSRDALHARAWIMREGGIPYAQDTDFDAVKRMVEGAAAKAVPTQTTSESKPMTWSYDIEFERFVRGDSKVFIGGANHAANIRRWWCTGDRPSAYVLLTAPAVARLGEEQRSSGMSGSLEIPPFVNRTVFAGFLAKRDDEIARRCRISLGKFFQQLGEAIGDAVRSSAREEQGWVRGITGIANERLLEGWGFLTDSGDMLSLLRDDDQWGPR